MRLIYTDKALSDIDFIGEFIRQDNPQRARSFVAEIFGICRDIPAFPLAYPLLEAHRERQIRKRVHDNYVIIYRVRKDSVLILHVLRASRDISRLIYDEE